MPVWAETTLGTWGRVHRSRLRAARPLESGAVPDLVRAENDSSVVIHGGGRCYGDASLDTGGQAILTRSLNRIVEFDPAAGEVVCEAGVTFEELSPAIFPYGWCYPVSSATAAVTMGGAFANDIHSKNHHVLGGFGDHTKWVDLALASGEVVRASPSENADLYFASLGGMGLTGAVLRVCIRLMPIPSGSVDARYVPYPDLDAMLDAVNRGRETEEFLFGWIDVFARGSALGRGILESGRLAAADEGCVPPPRPRSIPFAPPTGPFLAPAMRRAARRRHEKLPPRGVEVRKDLFSFLFPLDHVKGFNKLYGRSGFYSIHAGFPPAAERAGIRAMLEEIAAAQAGSITAVVKPMRGPGRGLMSFPIEGMVLAADLPRRRDTPGLHDRLEALVLDHGGRLYVAKDALMSPGGFARMFPNLPAFRAALERFDPNGRFQSDLARRLRIRG